MSNLLATFTAADTDLGLLEEVTVRSPDRVTVLLSEEDPELLGEDSPAAGALRDRMAWLLSAIEQRTGATVVGLSGDRSQLAGEAFDVELAGAEALVG